MNGAEFVVQSLKEQNVTHVFGYPGDAIKPLCLALKEAGIKLLLCSHEQGAAMAAIGYARATGKTGVCIATTGATNLVTGLAEALFDAVPLIAITGQINSNLIDSDAFQEVDVLGLSLACTKYSFMIQNVKQLESVIDKAFLIANSGRPGSILIDIPTDVQLHKAFIPESIELKKDEQKDFDPSKVEKAIALIGNSNKPLLFVGAGVGISKAVPILRKFIEKTKIPSVCTLKGIGAISNDSEYFVGITGINGSKAANLVINHCDLLIVIGARFDERIMGKLDDFAPNAKIIHINYDAMDQNKISNIELAINSDIKSVIAAITNETKISIWQEQIIRMKNDLAYNYDNFTDDIYIPRLLNNLSQKIPKNTILCSDLGNSQMLTAQHMFVEKPENYVTSSALSSMGFGIPAAVGAQISRPDDMVLAILFDKSLLMNVQELATIKDQKLPIKIILIDDRGEKTTSIEQKSSSNDKITKTNIDFVTLASAFGIKGETISKVSEITNAISRLLESKAPYLLHVSCFNNKNIDHTITEKKS